MSTAFIQQVIDLTNQERAKLGLRPPNRNTGQLLAVLPGVDASLIGPEDFI